MVLHKTKKRREFIAELLLSATGLTILSGYAAQKVVLCPNKVRSFSIIKDGKSDYTIVMNPGASPSEKFAAKELVQYIRQCSGVELSISENVSTTENPAHMIILGCGEVSKGFGLNPNISQFGEQGFLLETIGESMVIAGTSGAGTLYGAYHFLENYFGIRWYAPDVTKIPSLSEVQVPSVKRIYTPSFLYREPYYAWPGKDRNFLTTMRINSGKRDETSQYGLGYGFYGMAHSYFNYVNPDEFFNEHPEYFSEIGGKRTRQETQLCLTNPEVFEIVAGRMLEIMRKHPDFRQYNFSQMDYYNGCQCDNCRSLNEKYGSDGATQFEFVNKLAEQTSKEFPDKLIGTLAYTYTEEVPKRMKMHPNVAVWLCHMLPCCDSHSIEKCERNAGYKRCAEEWSKVCSHLYIWHYIVDFAHYYNPFPNFRAMAADMRFYKRIGVEGIFAQGIGDEGGGGEFSLLRGYYCAKLLWNPEQDADEIIKDFLKGYYGAAWESLWKYISLLHDEVETNNIHLHLYVNPGYGHLSDEIVSQANRFFDQAEAAIADDNVLLDRIRVARMPLDYAQLFPRNGYRIESGRLLFKGKVGGPKEAGKFIEQMQKHNFRSIREGFSDPKQLLALSFMFSSGLPVVTLDNGLLSVDVVPALSGRVLRIIDKKSGRCVTAYNKVKSTWSPFTGGLENQVGEIYSPFGWTEPAEVTEQTNNSVTTRAKLGNGLILERMIGFVGDEGKMRVVSCLINPGGKTIEARLRSHLELDMGNLGSIQVSFTDKTRKRISPKMKDIISGMREGIHYYKEKLPDNNWSFRSGELEVVQSFDSAQVESAKIYAYPEDLGELELELWLPNQKIGSGGKITFEEVIAVKS
ncbi:MAG: hypothetical protein A2W90_06280 [Bacteroidetes bacterium GWF2_42_66]|nr:MAG: hypothetical protein A2W92_20790 [Bacteroidetes bacterium GWA2_42_15]OFX99647.1 MAG: hypothetical protein A2W89_00475 [Bacteroidetes bacterium GWE2_42_39]OFY39534.1 MAG: hypothetical protein A2W90_06280 [Bacteroidetes bacterium GWF2_42_66]HBL73600.1 hypothetical protein [Prolixibacteraceae bacterium]HCR89943.1 hypothetical protein [Prolixibacteraceae bacterium]